MDKQDKETYITEEALIVLHSGEIPEVAYHGSLYYLTEDPEGPGLELYNDDIFPLKQAVVGRYHTIILRDLDPENRDERIYRGLARCVANWQRLVKFCARENMDYGEIRDETANRLRAFLQKEIADVQSGKRSSCINCSIEEIKDMAESLRLSSADLPQGWQELCPTKT